MSRPTLKELRVRARIQAREDRAAWDDAKWQRVAAFALDFVGGSALGVALSLAVALWVFDYVARVL